MAEKIIADKNYYRDAEHNLVDESDEKAAFLVAGKGTEISPDVAEKYGIKVGKADSGEKASSPSENKSAAPSENKSKKKK